MRSVDLFFWLRIRLTISSLSEEGGAEKLIFRGCSYEIMEKYLNEEFCDQDGNLMAMFEK